MFGRAIVCCVGIVLLATAVCGCAARPPQQRPCTLIIDWNTERPRGERGIWLAYLMKRAKFHERDGDCGDTATVVVPSFEEECLVRAATLKTYRSLQEADPELNVPYFNDLSRVADAGFLREYVWVYLRQPSWTRVPDGLHLAEFDQWRESNLRNHRAQTEGSIRTVAGDE
jgi:hypothetical protein